MVTTSHGARRTIPIYCAHPASRRTAHGAPFIPFHSIRARNATTNDERRTTNDERRTTNDERRTTNVHRTRRCCFHTHTLQYRMVYTLCTFNTRDHVHACTTVLSDTVRSQMYDICTYCVRLCTQYVWRHAYILCTLCRTCQRFHYAW